MHKLQTLRQSRHFTKLPAALAVLVFATIGITFTFNSRAATPFASLEPEQGTKTAGATTGTDSTASGGQFVRFGGGAATPSPGDCLARSLPVGVGMEWPNECNTGVIGAGLSYSQLTPSSSITTSSDGQVIENLDITGRILVKHNNVTIRNSRITCQTCLYIIDSRTNTGLTISYVEIDGVFMTDGKAIYGGNFTANNLNMHGMKSPITVLSDVTVEDSYIHDFVWTEGTHSAGISISTPTEHKNIILRHNNIHQKMDNGASAAISIYNNDVITNVLIENNLLNTSANYCMHAGAVSSKAGPSATYARFIDNHFDRALSPNCGTSGPVASRDSSAEGYEWRGNVWHDTGEIVP